jgi:hypothetical protein
MKPAAQSKPTAQSKPSKHSLIDTDQYNKDLDASSTEIMSVYTNLITEYFNFITENIKIKNNGYSKFIIVRGLETITHVFNHVLFYTKHIDITFVHCQKAFYFYVEFICQISEAEKMFLQLSSRDAVTYVYKKTIFDIPNDYIKKMGKLTEETSRTMTLVAGSIQVQKILIMKMIQDDNKLQGKGKEKEKERHMETFQKIINQITNSNLNVQQYTQLKMLIELIYNKLYEINIFFDVVEQIIEKISVNPTLLDEYEKKINQIDFEDELSKIIEHCGDAAHVVKFISIC